MNLDSYLNKEVITDRVLNRAETRNPDGIAIPLQLLLKSDVWTVCVQSAWLTIFHPVNSVN